MSEKVYKIIKGNDLFWNDFENMIVLGETNQITTALMLFIAQEEREDEFWTRLCEEEGYNKEVFVKRYHSDECLWPILIPLKQVELLKEDWRAYNWIKEHLNEFGLKKLNEYSGEKHTYKNKNQMIVDDLLKSESEVL